MMGKQSPPKRKERKGVRLASMQIAEMSLDVKYTFASLTPSALIDKPHPHDFSPC